MVKNIKENNINEEQLKNIGVALKKLRLDKGYTNYEYLAHDLNMSRSHYGKYEQGNNMTLVTLLKILNFHKISLTSFCNEYLCVLIE
jgi:transcriptional regulator with XRE-family HTH domain